MIALTLPLAPAPTTKAPAAIIYRIESPPRSSTRSWVRARPWPQSEPTRSRSPRPPPLHHALQVVPHQPPLHTLRRPPIRPLLACKRGHRWKRISQEMLHGVAGTHDPAIIRHAPRLDHVRVPFLPPPEAVEPVDQLGRADHDVPPLDFITKLVNDPGANLGGHLPAERG